NIRPPLLPPVLRGKALRFLIRIRTMPFIGGQPLPRGLFSRPAPAIAACAVPGHSLRPDDASTRRWVSSSCFCAGPEGVGSARGGVVPGSCRCFGGLELRKQ